MRMTARPLRHLLKCDRGIAALEFVFLAPALLLLAFGIIVYSIYFTAVMGVRQAAGEGARAAQAGLSGTERAALAQARAHEVLDTYGTLLGGGAAPVVTTAPVGTGVFEVRVSYDMSASPIMRYGSFVPLPSPSVEATVTVTNGSY
ncbi:TadE/TadG family type IV pilus assembly protein [Novosphingobium album (ex Liu et al. 2023)]|uniref:TadE/TadG family type IV pilus assembly protein n=1 Tax=Novosphingobium album (ex Liu et al. 2023) TaxID=3031130 RepID=A0ABT5WKD0_9SPHN|nr:TadE/TadG family type IV pilus assembly protein [Novosphingobium album (ex Liu et al. 2023)]MDE8650507.1 TadE/TadG family type IV pilus assembly protein [Novosphingobium album (ex Liu et al. 2023)]